jgi:hypothetical protein
MDIQQAKTKAKRIGKNTLIILLLSGIIIAIGYYFYRSYVVSEGTRSGILFKISKKGIVFKTFEGQLQLAGSTFMNKESIWPFSAKNKEVYMQLQHLEGKKVKLFYEEKVDAFVWQGETDYIVHKVEELK